MHYLPTASRTMCGQLVTERTPGTADLREFADLYRAAAPTNCPRCVRVMRRYPRLAGPLNEARAARVRDLGLDIAAP